MSVGVSAQPLGKGKPAAARLGDQGWLWQVSHPLVKDVPIADTEFEKFPVRFVSVNVTGLLRILLKRDETSDLVQLEQGKLYRMEVKQYEAAGTTATGILFWG